MTVRMHMQTERVLSSVIWGTAKCGVLHFVSIQQLACHAI